MAETAPGVGSNTDIHLITRDGVNRLWPKTFENLERLYKKYQESNGRIIAECVKELSDSLKQEKTENAQDAKARELNGENPPADAGANSNATEAAPEDKGPKSKYVPD